MYTLKKQRLKITQLEKLHFIKVNEQKSTRLNFSSFTLIKRNFSSWVIFNLCFLSSHICWTLFMFLAYILCISCKLFSRLIFQTLISAMFWAAPNNTPSKVVFKAKNEISRKEVLKSFSEIFSPALEEMDSENNIYLKLMDFRFYFAFKT